MNANLDHWVRKWFVKVTATATVLLLVNAGAYFFGVARLGVLAAKEGEAARLEEAALREREALARATAAQVESFREGKRALDTLALDHLKTQGERLTAAQEALDVLAKGAGLTLGGVGYGYTELPANTSKERWSRGYIEAQLRFTVSGSYPQIKKFLGDLQASPQFFIVSPPSISASGQGAVLLNMNLTASTLFVAGDPPPEASPDGAALPSSVSPDPSPGGPVP